MAFDPLPRQRLAIEAPLGPVLVVAGPGAGKTFCLIARIEHLITTLGIAPERICAVTFTNRADALGCDAERRDEVLDAGDEAEGLPRARPRDHEDGAEGGFNGEALPGERVEGHGGNLAGTRVARILVVYAHVCFQN